MKNKWVIQVLIISFLLSAIFTSISSAISDLNVYFLISILVIIIAIGIIFDMIGVAVLTANEAPFHAQNTKKVKSAPSCIKLLKNSDKVSSICNDVIGDICGIVSGSLGATLTIYMSTTYKLNIMLVTVILTAFISSITVGGKAYFKKVATKKSEQIVNATGKILNFFHI